MKRTVYLLTLVASLALLLSSCIALVPGGEPNTADLPEKPTSPVVAVTERITEPAKTETPTQPETEEFPNLPDDDYSKNY